MKQISCEQVASPEKEELTTFCSTSGLWCPIRLFRVCEKRLKDNVQLITNVLFDPNVFESPVEKKKEQVKNSDSSKGIMIRANSKKNSRYRGR